MNYKTFLLLIVIGGLFSCQDKKPTAPIVQQEVKLDRETSSKIQIRESAKFVENWAELSNLELELKSLFSRSLKSEKDVELLKTRLEELKTTIPEKYKTPAISARIKVLETNIFMLEQSLKDGVVKGTDKKLVSVFKSYNTLVGQIEALIIKEKDYEKYK